MKIDTIQIYRENKVLMKSYDLSNYGFFEKGTVREFLDFTVKLVVERSETEGLIIYSHENYVCLCIKREQHYGVAIVHPSYPKFVGAKFVEAVLNEPHRIHDLLKEYSVPENVDKLTKAQKEVDETIEVLSHAFEKLLERGEKLDDLIDKSNDLSATSKLFYKNTKKLNSCCMII